MSQQRQRFRQYYETAREWVESRVLRPNNLTRFVQYLMLEAARQFPELAGLDKKSLVESTLEDLLEDERITTIKKRGQLKLAVDKLVDSWITAGINAHKQKFLFDSDSGAPTQLTGDVVANVADAAEAWFTGRVVTAANIVMGIVAIMQAAGKFFKGDGETKKDMVLRIVKEIVQRESTVIQEEDRDAILLAIDTFAPTVISYMVDMVTGNFDFKGFVEKIKATCAPLSSCCTEKPEKGGNLGTENDDLSL